MKKLLKGIAIGALALGLFAGVGDKTEASTMPLESIAEKVSTHLEQKIVGYKDVEKIGYRDVEKVGYRDVEKTGYRDVEKEVLIGQNQVTIPYEEKFSYPVYDWVVDGYYAKKGVCFDTKPILNSGGLEVRTKDKAYTCASTDREVKLTQINKEWGKAKVTFVTYANVPKTTKTYTAKKSVQGYTKTNSKYKLTARNYKGKKVDIKIAKGTKLSIANKTWYKGKIKYNDYKKVGKRWKRYTKTATVYVHYKNVKTTSKKVYTWTKQTKTADGYFNLQPTVNMSTNEIRKDIHWRQVGTRIDTVTNYRTEMQDVYETQMVKEPYSYIEKEEYTYTEKEEYTYIAQEPIYEEVKVENTAQVKYQSIVNYYWQYRLTESELLQLFDMTGVKYSVVNGYDKSRYVNGFLTVNGVTTSYQFTPSTLVKLVLFEDHSAINVSYLTTVYGKEYADVEINEGSYTVQ
ncbi:hypothetical protein [Neobacillus drentensis]|uniref:hypothetical protein n=1 Tax=Neobacillus drentensis TaxID=220684 RepID=UPI002FFECF71